MPLTDEERQSWLSKIKTAQHDPSLWMGLAKAAHAAQDVKFAFQGYLSTLRLQPDNQEAATAYIELRSQWKQTIPLDSFQFELFRVPNKAVVMMLAGTINMGLDAFEQGMLSALHQGYRCFIYDCACVHRLTGLGPSFLRRMQQTIEKVQGKLLLFQADANFQNVLELKKITIPIDQDFNTIMRL